MHHQILSNFLINYFFSHHQSLYPSALHNSSFLFQFSNEKRIKKYCYIFYSGKKLITRRKNNEAKTLSLSSLTLKITILNENIMIVYFDRKIFHRRFTRVKISKKTDRSLFWFSVWMINDQFKSQNWKNIFPICPLPESNITRAIIKRSATKNNVAHQLKRNYFLVNVFLQNKRTLFTIYYINSPINHHQNYQPQIFHSNFGL